MSEDQITLVNQDEDEIRLDRFLTDGLEGYSRTFIQKLISAGQVTVNGSQVSKKSGLVPPQAEVQIVIPPSQESHLKPEQIPLDILFENRQILAVNKPAGMVVHPGPGHSSGTLVQAVLGYAPEMEGVGGIQRPGLVHRLDQETSGVILLAKNDSAHQILQEQFQRREVQKSYLALVDGRPPSPSGRVEVAIGRDPRYRQRMAAVPDKDGKRAVSEYFTLEQFPRHTYLRVALLTGRTHQIRVHLSFLKCPVAGDTTYGRKKPTLDLKRHFLHAHQLTLVIPGESGPRTIEAPLAPDLSQILDELRHPEKGAGQHD